MRDDPNVNDPTPPPAEPDRPNEPPDDPLRHTACLGCGYALRGLALTDVCPECGLAATDSLRRLVVSPDDVQAWRRVHRGLRLLPIAALGPAVSATAAGVWWWSGALPRHTAPMAALTLGLLIEAALAWPATRALTVTRLDTTRQGVAELRALRERRDARAAAVTLGVFDLLAIGVTVAAFASAWGVGSSGRGWGVDPVLMVFAALAWLPGVVLRGLWMRALAGWLGTLASGLSGVVLDLGSAGEGLGGGRAGSPRWPVTRALRAVAASQAVLAVVTLGTVCACCLPAVFMAWPWVASALALAWVASAGWVAGACARASATVQRHVADVQNA